MSTSTEDREYQNLVFQGGGVLGTAYGGALTALSEFDVLKDVRRVAGTSAGAITAGLVALGYSPSEIGEILTEMDFSQFTDRGVPFSIPVYYGLYRGDYFTKWFGGLIGDMPDLDENATFEDLEVNDHPELYVFATDLTEHRPQEFSFRTTPGVRVVDAVRASISIPMFFYAIKFPDEIPNDHLYIDGGLLQNFPLTLFDAPPFTRKPTQNPRTLGFKLYDMTPDPHDVKIKEFYHLKQYVEEMFEMTAKPPLDTSELWRSVVIDTLGLSAVNFKLTDQQKRNLVDSGYKATKSFLTKGPPRVVRSVSGSEGTQETLEYGPQVTPEQLIVAKEGLRLGTDIVFGEQPSEVTVKQLKDQGFRSVINIRPANEYPQFNALVEGDYVRSLGMEYCHFPTTDLNDKLVEQFREQLLKIPKPVYVHSGHARRAGAFVISVVANELGMTGDQALDKAREQGMPVAPKIDRFIKTYVDTH